MFIEHSSIHRRDQLLPVDKTHLQGQNAKQQIAIGG
jgi:hypothetical protein